MHFVSTNVRDKMDRNSHLSSLKQVYGDLDLIILFINILSLYAINLSVVILFADSSFMFLAILIMLLYLIYSIILNE